MKHYIGNCRCFNVDDMEMTSISPLPLSYLCRILGRIGEKHMKAFKQAIVDEYGPFAFTDRRIKNLDYCDIFFVDGRSKMDLASDRKPFGWFCVMELRVVSRDQAELVLSGNIPTSLHITKWLKNNKLTIDTTHYPRLSINISSGNMHLIDELAASISAITQPGAPRYSVPNYKYACPQASSALRRLSRVLKKVWNP